MAARKTTPKAAAAKAAAKPASPELEKAVTEAAAPKPKPKAEAKAKAAAFQPRIGDEKLVQAAKDAAFVAKAAIVKRDNAIKAAVNGGTSARQVAIAVGLSHPAVLKISRRA